jgi:hypothetical protein
MVAKQHLLVNKMKTKIELEAEFEKLFSEHKAEYEEIMNALHKAYEIIDPLKEKALAFAERTGIPFVLGDESYFPNKYDDFEYIAGSDKYSYHSFNLDSVRKLTGVYYFPSNDWPPGGWQSSSTQC